MSLVTPDQAKRAAAGAAGFGSPRSRSAVRGSFTPRVSLYVEAHVWYSVVRRICRTERADRTLVQRQMRYAIDTAITSEIVRARHDSVQAVLRDHALENDRGPHEGSRGDS